MTRDEMCPFVSGVVAHDTIWVPCIREKCKAWVITSAACNSDNDCEECAYGIHKPNCEHFVMEEGYCKLINPEGE